MNKTIRIMVEGGLVYDVQNLPKGYDYELFDFDVEEYELVENEQEPFETDKEYEERIKEEGEYVKVDRGD